MEYYVNKRAKLKCPWGSEQPELDVVHIGDPVILCDELMANIADNKPMVNIKPFGKCSSLANPAVAAATSANYGRLQKLPCVPITPSPWLGGKMDLIINGSPALLSTCKCACSWSNGRLIEIAHPGQDTVYVDGPMTITITEPTMETQQSLMASGLQPSQGVGAGMASLPQSFGNNLVSQSTAAGASAQSPLLIKKVEGAKETYPRQKIVYKVTEYNKKKSEMSDEDKSKEIKWAVRAGNNVTKLLEDRGEKITLDIDKGWEYKDILVMAYINSYSETVSQKTKVLDDPYGSTLIRGVVGEDEACVGQEVEYKVINSNKDGSASNVAEGSDVKWAIKVGESGSIDKNMLENMRGKKTITLKMKPEWSGKDIFVMPYLNSPTPTVSVKTEVRIPCVIVNESCKADYRLIDEDLTFCGSIATAYSWLLNSSGNKVFLRGNVFLAKIAKAVFGQDENLFARTCEQYKDEEYLLGCSGTLKEYGFIVEEGENADADKNTWLGLYRIVLLLTEEYLATKLEGGLLIVESFECSENNASTESLEIIVAPQNASEGSLNGTALVRLRSLSDSSDSLLFSDSGDLFYKFLSDSFPFKNSREGFKKFVMGIYDEEVCTEGNLDWLYQKVTSNSLPRPVSIKVGVMEAEVLGAYKDNVIYINQRLALNSLHSPESCFTLLLTLLHEYGHFLDDVLYGRIGNSDGDSEGDEGMAFACRFMEYSPANLFNGGTRLRFAELASLDCRGCEQRFPLEIPDASDLSYDDKKSILAFFESGEDLENGTLKLPKDGTIVENVEFFFTRFILRRSKGTHQTLTKDGSDGIEDFTHELEEGCMWPDVPKENAFELGSLIRLGITFLRKNNENGKGFIFVDISFMHKSHFGAGQHWHSMHPQLKETNEENKKNEAIKSIELLESNSVEANELKGRLSFFYCNNRRSLELTNDSVREIILKQCEKWYSKAIEYKRSGDRKKMKQSHFYIGKLCHMVQDSFVLAHSWRRYTGDDDFEIGLQRITDNAYNGCIWTFQGYRTQNSSLHKVADKKTQKNVMHVGPRDILTIGYISAEAATKGIMERYSKNTLGLEWNQGGTASPRDYLENIYRIYPGRENLPSGESHPWFKKESDLNKSEVKERLFRFSNPFGREVEMEYIRNVLQG